MSKKMKILLTVLIPVLLLAIGGASLAFAADPPAGSSNVTASGNTTAIKGLLPRVAAILGISEQTLKDAYAKAEQQIKDEEFFKALDKAVASGRLTRDEANKLKAWWQQKPVVANRGFAPFARIFGQAHLNGGRGKPPVRLPPGISSNITGSGNVTPVAALLPRVAVILGIPLERLESAIKQAEAEMLSDRFLAMLEQAVKRGVITQAEADQIKVWWQQRPVAVNRLLEQLLKGRAIRPPVPLERPGVRGLKPGSEEIRPGMRGLKPGIRMPGTANQQGTHVGSTAPVQTY